MNKPPFPLGAWITEGPLMQEKDASMIHRDKYNVRPIGFVDACVKAHRMDLVKALDYGWHVANMAEPVVLDDGMVIGSVVASKQLEMICQG